MKKIKCFRVLVQVQRMDLYEQKRPIMLVPVQAMDLYKHLTAIGHRLNQSDASFFRTIVSYCV